MRTYETGQFSATTMLEVEDYIKTEYARVGARRGRREAIMNRHGIGSFGFVGNDTKDVVILRQLRKMARDFGVQHK